MKRQRKNPAKKTVPAKKAAKPTRRKSPKIDPEKILRSTLDSFIADELARSEPAGLLGGLKRRCEAAEQKAARLEEENVKFAKELIRWQDTVKLRDEAIARKEKQVKEQMAINQQLTSQVTELTGMQEGLAPSGLQYGKVLEAEVEARKQAQEELDATKKKCEQLGSQWMAAIEELVRYKKPAVGEGARIVDLGPQAMPVVPCWMEVTVDKPCTVRFTYPTPSLKVDESIVPWSQGG